MLPTSQWLCQSCNSHQGSVLLLSWAALPFGRLSSCHSRCCEGSKGKCPERPDQGHPQRNYSLCRENPLEAGWHLEEIERPGRLHCLRQIRGSQLCNRHWNHRRQVSVLHRDRRGVRVSLGPLDLLLPGEKSRFDLRCLKLLPSASSLSPAKVTRSE